MNETFKNLMILYCMDAPHWARYAAVDGDGELWVYDYEPTIKDGMWAGNDLDYSDDNDKSICDMTLGDVDWTDTLIEL